VRSGHWEAISADARRSAPILSLSGPRPRPEPVAVDSLVARRPHARHLPSRQAPRSAARLVDFDEDRFERLLEDRVAIELPEDRLWVVSLEGLAEMKRLAGRPQDIADLQRLGLDDED